MSFLSNLYLYSDVDGTLVSEGHKVHDRNIAAIERFVAYGGNFGIATGRCTSDIDVILRQIPVNLPCILNNGAQIYDAASNRVLRDIPLPELSFDHTVKILDNAPEVGLLIVNDDGYFRHDNPYSAHDFALIDDLFPVAHLSEIPGPYRKFLFLLDPSNVDGFWDVLNTYEFEFIDFTQSSDWSVEMVPAGVNKGTALLDVCRMLDITITQTIAIGDNMNDLEMLRSAGFSATVSAASEVLKNTVNLVVGECADGALADLIDFIQLNQRQFKTMKSTLESERQKIERRAILSAAMCIAHTNAMCYDAFIAK